MPSRKITMADVAVSLKQVSEQQELDGHILVRCTRRERESIRTTAHELGLSMSVYIRALHRLALESVGREV